MIPNNQAQTCKTCNKVYLTYCCQYCEDKQSKLYRCKYCYEEYTIDKFYTKRTNECKKCLKEQVRCDECYKVGSRYKLVPRGSLNTHNKTYHADDIPPVSSSARGSARGVAAAKGGGSILSMMVGEKRAQVIKDFVFKHEDDPCKCCGQSKVLMINRRVCKDCNNLSLRQKVTCKTCDKELTKGSYNNHHKMCERIRG